MCGIAGFYGFRDDSLIHTISDQLKHRGPDGEGFFIDENITLFNRRLAIIDRKGGDQPIYNEDKSIIVVYNGEIYNYRELRKELEKFNHIFTTQSDTEVIAHGYEQWGEACFDRFNGMFAIALYDKKKEDLILARDHFGIKPLYYAFINSKLKIQNLKLQFKIKNEQNIKFIFSSEIKPIFYSGLIEKKPNDRIIYRYLKYRIHDDQKETFFDGIYRLMPGEILRIKNEDLRFKNYSRLKEDLLKENKIQSLDNKTVEKFKKMLIESVKLRLISEVPVGTCLSGGLDSSTVVAIANQLLKDKNKEAESLGKTQHTFSAVFPGSKNDEEKYINTVIKSIKSESHKVYPKPEEFFKDIEDFVRTQEEPTISTGPYAQYKVMQEASKHVTVLLDGQGADEMMAGYLPYYFVYLRQLKKQKKYGQLFNEMWKSKDILGKYVVIKLKSFHHLNDEKMIKEVFHDEFMGKFEKETFTITQDDLKKRLHEDIFTNSLQSLLRYEDRNSMWFSIEGRVPFLDMHLLRFIFSLSDEAIIKNGWNKYILRQALKGLLPDKIVNRRNKIGFTTPEEEWFLRMKNRIYMIFASESFGKRKYFNQENVLKAFQSYIEGKTTDSMLFWRILNVELWMREFFDSLKVGNGLKPFRTNNIFILGNPNIEKKIEIEVEGKKYYRYPIRTELFKKGDDYGKKISEYIINAIINVGNGLKPFRTLEKKWFVVVSEKIVAIAQGRSYFIWDIKTGFWAKFLSKFVKKTPYGIGLGSQWTMQLAINELGLTRILFASIISVLTKPFGIQGLFYNLAGREAAAIDGPTEYSVYPSNVSAKLAPKDPQKVAKEIHERIKNYELRIKNFQGVVIIDANDIGQNVLGNSTGLPNSLIEKIFKDNPMGQGSEQTPIIIITN